MPRRGEPLAPPFAIKPDGCYLITGAFGGFGKVLADGWWIVARATSCLSSRSGASTPDAAEVLCRSLRDRGVDVQVVKADVGSAERRAAADRGNPSSGQPLRGVFHLAMVIDDAPLAALTPRAHADRDGTEGAWRMAAARGHAGS